MIEKRFEYNHEEGGCPYIYDVEDNHMIDDLKILCELLNLLDENNNNLKIKLEDEIGYKKKWKKEAKSHWIYIEYLENRIKQLEKNIKHYQDLEDMK